MDVKYDSNQVHYIVVTGIVVRDGKYLIAKRAEWEPAFPGRWTVPGGKLKVLDYVLKKKDTSEHWYNVLENVLIQEIREEVGLEIENIGYITSMVYARPDGIPCLIVSLYADAKEGEILLAKALTEYAWISLEEAKNYDLITGIYEELEMLDIFLKTGKRKVWGKQ